MTMCLLSFLDMVLFNMLQMIFCYNEFSSQPKITGFDFIKWKIIQSKWILLDIIHHQNLKQ